MLHLTRCWAPKPRGLMELSLWRLDTSTRTGHSRNMKGHEVSNPSRQPVEMSVRHSASTTFHRAKHLFMSEQIGRSSNLFSFPWLQYDECGKQEREEEQEGVWGDSSAQFIWKHCDTLQGCVLTLAPHTILSERLQQQQLCTTGLPALPLHQTTSPFTSSPLHPLKINPNTRAKANISLFMYLLTKKSVPDTCLFLFLSHLSRGFEWQKYALILFLQHNSYKKSSYWPLLMLQTTQCDYPENCLEWSLKFKSRNTALKWSGNCHS